MPSRVTSVNYIPWSTPKTKSVTPPAARTPVSASGANPSLTVPLFDPNFMMNPPTTLFPNQAVSYADTGGEETPYINANNNVQYLNPDFVTSKNLPYINPSATSGGDGSGGGWGGSGGSGGTVGGDITWSEGYQVEGAPDWWRGLVPSAYTPNSEYVALYNAMIPYMSPEDQRTAGQYLFSVIGNQSNEPWMSYNPEMMSGITPPTAITPDLTEEFTSSERVQNALGTLTKLIETSGRKEEDMGAGYGFLRNILATIEDYAGQDESNRQTRAQYQQMQGALDPLLSQSKSGELSPFNAVAQQVASPFFSAGNVVPVSKSATGQFRFGNRNPEFYG